VLDRRCDAGLVARGREGRRSVPRRPRRHPAHAAVEARVLGGDAGHL